MVKFIEAINGLLNKFDKTGNDWEKALETKQMEFIEVQAELQQKQQDTADLKRMVLLGEVTEATFSKEQQKLDELEAKKTRIMKDMQLISEYRSDDLEMIYEELDKEKSVYIGKQRAEIQKLQNELLHAKAMYLQKLVDASTAYEKMARPERLFQEVQVKLGKKRQVYMSNSNDALNPIRIGESSYINLAILQNEIYDALQFGKIDSQLQRVVTEAKAEGLLK